MSNNPAPNPEHQNRRALFVGLPEELGVWLERRLPGVVVTSGPATDATLDDLKSETYSLLVVDYKPNKAGDSDVLPWIRTASTLTRAQLLFCLDQGAAGGLAYRIVGEFAGAELLYHPIDREELARRVAITLGAPEPPIRVLVDSTTPDLLAAVAAVWDQFRDAMLTGLDVMDQTIE
ncbi:MAG TPA: hypothetical protein VKT80_06565, partial [Chloroflexota bacterium]|nr:hypothetical protein [Chloroflexota bacterium]